MRMFGVIHDVYCRYSFLYQAIKILHCCFDPDGEFLPVCSMYKPYVSGKVFVLGNKLSITDDQIEGILERTVTKLGTSAQTEVSRRHLGKRF
jgi:putative transposon-encoded protein